MKYTQAQVNRSMRKLAVSMAEANFPRGDWTDRDPRQRETRLWSVFEKAWKVLQKTGVDSEYHRHMKRLARERFR